MPHCLFTSPRRRPEMADLEDDEEDDYDYEDEDDEDDYDYDDDDYEDDDDEDEDPRPSGRGGHVRCPQLHGRARPDPASGR